MNITFKILWFEDEPVWYEMEKRKIEQIIGEHNLIPGVERKDGSDFNIDELTGHDYDLILMDYKLAYEETGDKIAVAIREKKLLTDMLFYSSEYDTMLTVIRSTIPPLDGIYFSKRDTDVFTEKVKDLIAKIVRRSEDIVNLRGFVLDNTSNFEVRIKDILNVCWVNFEPESRNILQEKVINLLEGKKGKIEAEVNRAKSSEDIFTFSNNDNYLLTVKDRLEILQEIINILLNVYGMKKQESIYSFKNHYLKDINIYRNRLGHVKIGENTISINGTVINIDQNLHRLLRKNIFEINKEIQSIENFLDSCVKR